MPFVDFKKSISDPYMVDTGNKVMQNRTESKTLKFGLFTTNKNAVWAARNQLRKESFPFANVAVSVNRNLFRMQVGDLYLYNYSKYSSENLVIRILQIEEDDLNSENIILIGKQDVFSVTNTIEAYLAPVNNAGQGADYSVDPFVDQAIFENPYVLSTGVEIIPVASRLTGLIIGFNLYMSVDGGASYSLLNNSNNIQPYGVLDVDYGITYDFDDYAGMTIDFVSDVDSIENVTFADILSGDKNTALIGDEMISFQSITPISGTKYLIEDIIRGRYGTVKKEHSIGEDFWFMPKSVGLIDDINIITGAVRKFKLVPYNNKKTGSIIDATPIDITIEGEAKKPYEPGNFNANGESFNPIYVSGTDITTTWNGRNRVSGAGIGSPGIAYVDGTYEGLFKIEVYVSAVLVRTTTAIASETWDYTNAMNVSDNGTPAQEITFILYNYIEDGGIIYESDPVQVICNKE